MEHDLADARESALAVLSRNMAHHLSRLVIRADRRNRTHAMCAVFDERGKSMKASIRSLAATVLVVAAFAVVTPFSASDAVGQQKPAGAAKQLTGHWTLVSVKNEQDGKTTEPLGPNPKGIFILDGRGHYALMISRPDIPKFASNSRNTGTPEENKAVVVGALAHFGTYSVNEKEGTYSIRPEASTYPNWVGIDQKRSFSISKDELKIVNPSGSRGGTATLIWKRTK
jgi:hypothetical protein